MAPDDYDDGYGDYDDGIDPRGDPKRVVQTKYDGAFSRRIMSDEELDIHYGELVEGWLESGGSAQDPVRTIQVAKTRQHIEAVFVDEENACGIWRVPASHDGGKLTAIIAYCMTTIDGRWEVSALGTGNNKGDLFLWGMLNSREISDLNRGKFPSSLSWLGRPGQNLSLASHGSRGDEQPFGMPMDNGGRGRRHGPRSRPDPEESDDEQGYGGHQRGRRGRQAGGGGNGGGRGTESSQDEDEDLDDDSEMQPPVHAEAVMGSGRHGRGGGRGVGGRPRRSGL